MTLPHPMNAPVHKSLEMQTHRSFAEKKKEPDLSEYGRTGVDRLSKYSIGDTNPDTLIKRKGMAYLDKIRRDTHVSSQLRTRRQRLLARGWVIQPAGDRLKDRKIAEFVSWALDNMEGAFEQDLSGLLTAIGYGFALEEIVWKYIEGGKYNGMVGIKALRRKSVQDYHFDCDEFGALKPDGILYAENRYSLGNAQRLQRSKFIHYVYGDDDDNPYGDPTLSKVAFWAWLKKNISQFWAIYAEKFGMPTAVANTPRNASPADKSAIEDLLLALQAESGIRIPEGFDIKFLEAVRNGDVKYDNFIERCNKEISKEIVGQTLSAEEGKRGQGSYALGTAHLSTLEDYTAFDARQLAACINEQLIRRLVDFNYQVDEYPQLVFAADPNMVVIMQNLDVLTRNMEIPASWMHKKLNIPMARDGETVLTPVEAAAAGGIDNRATSFSEPSKPVKRFDETPAKDKQQLSAVKAVEKLVDRIQREQAAVFDEAFESAAAQIRKKLSEGEAFESLPGFRANVGALKKALLSAGIWSWFAGMYTAHKLSGEVKIFADDMPPLRFGTPEEAFDAFKSLVPVTREQFDDLVERYTDRYFTVSGMTQQDIEKVFDQIGLSLEEGWTWSEFDAAIDAQKANWVVGGAMTERSRLIFQNAMMRSFRDAENDLFDDPDVANTIWGYRYLAILDDRVRDRHAALHGITRAKDDDFWRHHDPPWDHNCRCSKVPVFTWEIDDGTENESETVPDVDGGFLED